MQPIQGLQQAFNPQDDPLGVALQQRAKATNFQNRLANPMATIGHLFDPQWDTFFQAVSEAGGGRPVKMNMGGYDTTPNIANDPNSTFNTTGGPFGSFGAGTGGVESQPPSNPTRLTESSAPVAGLQKAAPRKRVGR